MLVFQLIRISLSLPLLAQTGGKHFSVVSFKLVKAGHYKNGMREIGFPFFFLEFIVQGFVCCWVVGFSFVVRKRFVSCLFCFVLFRSSSGIHEDRKFLLKFIRACRNKEV